ncbi:protein-export chaperone SecB [Lacrimispora sp.]|uniref:protein-export chaperone SecB n=1 Tax=Lacrimispora sp. TaxID=2719234 RepID=UPI0028AEAB25|nr:protein-export chaperone SecB [Lacrimispora sp.]
MRNKSIIEKSESILSAKKIYFEKIFFQRSKHNGNIIKFSDTGIGKEIIAVNENEYKCSINLNMSDNDEDATLEIKVSGIFELRGDFDEETRNVIIAKNTMAILFPYLRSQVTLLTAQPDVEAVILPPININALLENLEDE